VATLAWIERQIAERDRRVERTPEMKRTELFKLYNDIMGHDHTSGLYSFQNLAPRGSQKNKYEPRKCLTMRVRAYRFRAYCSKTTARVLEVRFLSENFTRHIERMG
jgi:hypothetical protein